ncbi:MAG TPA: hypothetical protein VM864_09295 [Pyrinomonadaceae bacterium]|jgi:hypothetical protein|nr:hypothetical protein [Pyrinomonadaceae bacterium]
MNTSRFRLVSSLIALPLLAGLAVAQKTPAARAQQQPAPAKRNDPPRAAAREAAGDEKPFWNLKVTKGTPRMVTLKSKSAPLAEVAAELSKKLGAPVLLSPLMQKQRVTLDFANVPVEGAVRLLAPLPYADYEMSGAGDGQPKIMALYLYAFDEEPPSRTAVVKGNDESILIEGNTEEGTESYDQQKEKEEFPLRIKFERNQLSVHAAKQPLTVILYEIASKVDIPFDMKYESPELVDVDFSNYTMEQAVRTLSPNIRLYVRTNLTNYETTPLRMTLVPPAGSQPVTNN